MSGGILRFPWTSQPQTPVGVSRGDSLTRGLIRLWGTPSGYESATGSRATPQSGANASYFAGGIKFASAIGIGAVSGVDAGSITELRALGDFTVITLAIPNGLIARQTLWEISGASELGVATGYSTATSIFSYARGAGDFVAQTGSGMFVDGQRVCVGYTYKNSLTADFYKNGKLHASANTSSGGTVSSSITNFHIGGRGSSNLATWAGVIEFTAVWNRALSASEHAQIAANPWQLFAPIQRTIWVPAAAGGSSTSLVIQDATHAHTADSLVLTSSTALTIADALHAHTADSLVLTSSTALTIADALHAHAADNLVLTSATALTIADAAHAHAADNLTLTTTGSTSLTVADATHAHAADNLVLTSATALTIADATHAHAADNLTLAPSGSTSLTVADATHAHAADNLVLTSAHALVIADAAHAHAADNLTLTASGAPTLSIEDALHAHSADSIVLTSSHLLSIADALHVHRADSITLNTGEADTFTGPSRARIGDRVQYADPLAFTSRTPKARIGSPAL